MLAEVDARAALAPLRESLQLARGMEEPVVRGLVPWLAAVLVAEGLSNKEIAERLFIAPTTVRFHVTSLFNKLGAGTRARLVAVAAERGML
jgi:DNA-binding NarL/FixJ family response regulator